MSNPSVEAKASLEPQVDKYQEFHKSLDTTEFQAILKSIRQSEPPEEISKTELEIASIIRKETRNFPMCSLAITEFLFQETGINYLKIDNQSQRFHSLIIVTANDTLEMLDNQGEIRDENIRGQSTTDILNLHQRRQRKKINLWIGENLRIISKHLPLTPLNLDTIAQILLENRHDKECIKISRKLIPFFPKNTKNYLRLGNSLIFDEQYKDAIELAYQQIENNPNTPEFYPILGYSLANNPESPFFEKAIWAFKQFIEKATGNKDWEKYIPEAEREIDELEYKASINKYKIKDDSRRKNNLRKPITKQDK